MPDDGMTTATLTRDQIRSAATGPAAFGDVTLAVREVRRDRCRHEAREVFRHLRFTQRVVRDGTPVTAVRIAATAA